VPCSRSWRATVQGFSPIIHHRSAPMRAPTTAGTPALWTVAGNRADEGEPAAERAQQPLVVGPQDAPQQLGERYVVCIIAGRLEVSSCSASWARLRAESVDEAAGVSASSA